MADDVMGALAGALVGAAAVLGGLALVVAFVEVADRYGAFAFAAAAGVASVGCALTAYLVNQRRYNGG